MFRKFKFLCIRVFELYLYTLEEVEKYDIHRKMSWVRYSYSYSHKRVLYLKQPKNGFCFKRSVLLGLKISDFSWKRVGFFFRPKSAKLGCFSNLQLQTWVRTIAMVFSTALHVVHGQPRYGEPGTAFDGDTSILATVPARPVIINRRRLPWRTNRPWDRRDIHPSL